MPNGSKKPTGLVTPGIDLTSTELEEPVAISARTAVDARAERRTGWNAEQGASQPRTTRRKRQLFMVAAGGDYWGDERRPRSLSRQDPNSKRRVPRDISRAWQPLPTADACTRAHCMMLAPRSVGDLQCNAGHRRGCFYVATSAGGAPLA
mmetsp:Transcript_67580/g.186744  ORF Transcript_67580/g.186744 Transcript_67580/m.186744 type:complete len:150 (-) Transcript_67580:1123-1572(-)